MADTLEAQPYARDLRKLSAEDRALLGQSGNRAADANVANMPQNHSVHDANEMAHPVPLWMLLGTFGVLVFLSVMTVAVTFVDLGPLNIWIALGIAVVKAAFVAVIFMHLRWDNPFNAVALLVALCFLLVFVGVTLLDSGQYQYTKEPPGGWDTPAQEVP